MKAMKVIIAVALFTLSLGAQSVLAQEIFYVQRAVNHTYFVINGNNFTARDICRGVKRGDAVDFTEGSPHGVCISAVFVDLRTGRECSVWCH